MISLCIVMITGNFKIYKKTHKTQLKYQNLINLQKKERERNTSTNIWVLRLKKVERVE